MNKALALLLIFSLAFNIAFVGIWVHNRATRPAAPPAGAIGHRPADGQGLHRPGGGRWAQLGLTPAQEERLKASRRALDQKTKELAQKAREHRERLLALFEADPPDMQAAEAEQEALARVQREMRRAVMDQMKQMHDVLTPEQRRDWLRMMRSHGEGSRGRGPQAGPRAGGRRPRGGRPGAEPPRPGGRVSRRRPDAGEGPLVKEEGR